MKEIYVEEEFQEFRKLVVATRFSQVYSGIDDVALSLSSSVSLKLLFWVIDKMDEENLFVIRKPEKQDFILKCFQASGERKSISSVNKAIRELIQKRVIISTNKDGERLGRFFVNPGYFWRGSSQQDRDRRIKEFYEFLKFKANEEN